MDFRLTGEERGGGDGNSEIPEIGRHWGRLVVRGEGEVGWVLVMRWTQIGGAFIAREGGGGSG